ADARARLHPVGAISRFAPPSDAAQPRTPRARRKVLVLSGAGGDEYSNSLATAGDSLAPDWDWEHLGGSSGRWSPDPWTALVDADVVVTHAGEGILAEVSAARRPAVVLPQ